MNSSPWRYDLAPEDREEEDGDKDRGLATVAALEVSRAAASQRRSHSIVASCGRGACTATHSHRC